MQIAGGRKTAEQVKAATKECVAKHRDKKKALPKPKPSVTDDVTDSTAAAADDGRHFYNDPDKDPVTREEFDAAIKAMTEAELIASIKANLAAAEAENAKAQEYLLSAFTRTIDLAVSRMTEETLDKAEAHFREVAEARCAELLELEEAA
jgi:hypothetical protein